MSSNRQIEHHLADSHSIGLMRFKLGLTEDCPVVTPYDQDKFAELADTGSSVQVSLQMPDGVHALVKHSVVIARDRVPKSG